MPDRSDRVQKTAESASRLFHLALLLCVTMVAVLFWAKEQSARDRAEAQIARKQIEKLERVGLELVLARDMLSEQLLARYGAVFTVEQSLRQLAVDLRSARRKLDTFRQTRSDDEAETDDLIRQATALLFYNSSGARIEDAPTLEKAQLSHGSFSFETSLSDLPLGELARFLYVASLDPGGISTSELSELPAAAKIWKSTASDTARIKAATVWELSAAIRVDPSAFGLNPNALGQVTMNEVLSTYQQVRYRGRATDYIEQLGDAEVKPLGLGVPLTLSSTVRLAPWVLAVILAIGALLYRRAAQLSSSVPQPLEVALGIPALSGPKQASWTDGMTQVLELLLCLAPGVLIGWVAFETDTMSGTIVLPIVSGLYLYLCMREAICRIG